MSSREDAALGVEGHEADAVEALTRKLPIGQPVLT